MLKVSSSYAISFLIRSLLCFYEYKRKKSLYRRFNLNFFRFDSFPRDNASFSMLETLVNLQDRSQKSHTSKRGWILPNIWGLPKNCQGHRYRQHWSNYKYIDIPHLLKVYCQFLEKD
jgi:hypothetical protein